MRYFILINHQEEWPQSLKDFVQKTHSLFLPRQPPSSVSSIIAEKQKNIEPLWLNRMTKKKLHEVMRMGELALFVREKSGCEVMVDIGAGEVRTNDISIFSFFFVKKIKC